MPVAPSQKVGLTKQYIEGIQVPPGKRDRIYVHDAKTPALAICRTRGGSTSWYLVRRVNGRPMRVRLGGWPELTVEQARKLAAAKNLAIANGINPQAQKMTAREELTVGEGFARYLDHHAKPKRRSWRDMERMFNVYCAGLKGKRISDVSTLQIAELHNRLGEKRGPYQANRVLEMLRSMFQRCTEWKLTTDNPARGVAAFPERERERFIQPDEMPRFLAAVRAEQNTTLRDFILMCLWTGQRRGNVQAMRWAHLDLAQAVWRIPADETKTGDVYNVPLIEPAMQIVMDRRAMQAASENEDYRTSEYVFPGRFGRGHFREPKGSKVPGKETGWARICKAARITDLRVHDLRRTLGSWQAASGTSLQIIGKSLGHRNGAATAIYARLTLDPVRLAVNQAVAAMLEAKPAAKDGGE